MSQPTLPSFNLQGRTALISGASRGIGAAIARMLAAHGAHVILTSRKAASCQEVVDAIRGSGGSAEALACHIGDPEQIQSAFASLRARHNQLHILVNNAATNPYFGPVLATDAAAFQKTIDVNIRGYFLMSQTAASWMAEHQHGSIVNIASVNAVIPGAWQGIYSVSKAAVVSMTQAFAKECAPMGVRVNAVLPGLTHTRFASALTDNPALRDEILKHVPMARMAEPEEIAGAILYLVSDLASYTTGAALNVDGGYLLA